MGVITDVVARHDDLTGVRHVEVGCWPGEVRTSWHQKAEYPGMLVMAPRRFRLEELGLIWWGVVSPARGYLLITPQFKAGIPTDFLSDDTPPSAPMMIYLHAQHGQSGIQVVNRREW